MVSASRTKAQPVGVCQVVLRMFVPGLVDPGARDVDPEGSEAERTGLAIKQRPEDAGRVEPRHAEPVDRPVGRHQGAGVAVGEEGVVRDRRERRRHRRALRHSLLLAGRGRFAVSARRRLAAGAGLSGALLLRGTHDPVQGSCQPPKSCDQPVGGLRSPGAGLVRQDPRGLLEQRAADPPGLLDVVLAGEARAVADHRGMEEDLIRGRALPALLGELHVEVDVLGSGFVTALCVDQQTNPGGRVEPDHQLVGLGPLPDVRGRSRAEAVP